jgi:hypothetical protein
MLDVSGINPWAKLMKMWHKLESLFTKIGVLPFMSWLMKWERHLVWPKHSDATCNATKFVCLLMSRSRMKHEFMDMNLKESNCLHNWRVQHHRTWRRPHNFFLIWRTCSLCFLTLMELCIIVFHRNKFWINISTKMFCGIYRKMHSETVLRNGALETDLSTAMEYESYCGTKNWSSIKLTMTWNQNWKLTNSIFTINSVVWSYYLLKVNTSKTR